MFPELSEWERNELATCVRSPVTDACVAAILLGLDLWRGEASAYRDIIEEGTRPPLWRFSFGPSAAWQTVGWRSLPYAARILRVQIGALTSEVAATNAALARTSLPRKEIAPALSALERSSLAVRRQKHLVLCAIASMTELATDLALIQLLAHWLIALDNADRVAAARQTDEYEVFGYPGACRFCRQEWGIRRMGLWGLPPFHPGCRCFAQPRFARRPQRA